MHYPQELIDKILSRCVKQHDPQGRMITKCFVWQGITDNKGYGRIYYKGKQVRVHRVIYEAAHGPNKLLTLHRCDVPACCNLSHLWAGAALDNTNDMIAKGRANHAHKLTTAEVKKIRAQIAKGATASELAKEYRVSDAAIHCIRTGKNWRDVQ